MRRLLAAAAILALLDTGASAQQLPRSPAPGSAERQAILDALRPSLDAAIGERVFFADVHIAVEGGWAYVRAMPYARQREPKDDTRRILHVLAAADPYVYGLLRSESGWKVVEYVMGVPPGTTPYTGWPARHGAPSKLFMRDADSVALEAAMREYIDAFAAGDPARFLALLPARSPVWFYNSIPTPPSRGYTTRAVLAEHFRKKDWEYHRWFTGWEEGTTERLRDFYAEAFQSEEGRVMWRHHSDTVFVNPWIFPDGRRDPGFVRWKKEGRRWVVAEIGYPEA